MNDEIKKAVEILRNGGLILYPTDTVWGIGCDATNTEAVSRIYKLKNRDDRKAMLVLLDHENQLQRYINEVPEVAWELIEVSEKPLTLIFPGAKNMASNLIAEDGSLGIRIPKDEFCISLISKLRKPLVSTSANISGKPSPAIFSEIDEEIINGVDYVVNWRQDDIMRTSPSSIIKLDASGRFTIIRQ